MMKTIFKFTTLVATSILMYFIDLSAPAPGLTPRIQWMSEAHAVAGTHRRTRRRSVAVGYTAGASSAAAASAESTTQQQAATAEQQSATSQQQTAAPQESAGEALPLGTVVSVLPANCSPVTASGVQYQHCGADYYRAVFQGNNLVYVTARAE